MKKISCFILAALMLFTISGCKKKTQFEDEYMSYSHTIKNFRTVSKLTGADALTDTKSEWQVGGTDLGFPIYNSVNDTMYLAFGDTFSNNVNMTGAWRSNVLALSTDYNLTDGIVIDDFYKGPTGVAKAVIDGHHSEDDTEITKIPTGGIEVDGVMYMFYMSVKKWTTPGEWLVNYNGVVKSGDNGKSWERVYDLTWFNSSPTQTIVNLANESVDLTASSAGLSSEGRISPSFMQIFPIDGKDGYIYCYGIKEGRSGGVKLMRVDKQDIADFNSYEYYIGKTGDVPNFAKGRDGLALAEKIDDAYIVMPTVGEVSVMYNEYLNKWIISYFKSGTIVYCTADKPWGKFSTPEVIITADEYPGLYGGMCHEKYTAEGGKKFYIILSQWMPTYNTFIIEVELV